MVGTEDCESLFAHFRRKKAVAGKYLGRYFLRFRNSCKAASRVKSRGCRDRRTHRSATPRLKALWLQAYACCNQDHFVLARPPCCRGRLLKKVGAGGAFNFPLFFFLWAFLEPLRACAVTISSLSRRASMSSKAPFDPSDLAPQVAELPKDNIPKNAQVGQFLGLGLAAPSHSSPRISVCQFGGPDCVNSVFRHHLRFRDLPECWSSAARRSAQV